MSRAGMFVASIISLVLIGVGVWQFLPRDQPEATPAAQNGDAAEAGGTSLQAPAAGAMSVTAEPAHRGDLVKRITANGVAEAERVLRVAAEVQGKIERVAVVEGQWVDAGDLLVELDDAELLLERDRSAEAYFNRVMMFANNQLVIGPEDAGNAGNADAITAQDAEDALTFLRRYINDQAFRTMMLQPDLEERLAELTREDLYAALAQLTTQRVALAQAELNLVRTRVLAPFSGQVVGIDTNTGPNSRSWPVVGQRVSSGTELMMLVDPDPIRVRVEVIESEISYVRQGRRADVTFPAYPGERFGGTIEAIDAVVDAARKTLSVTVRLPNRDLRLKPGMFAQVVLDTEIFSDRLLVPVEAVLLRDNRQLVFVVRNGRAEWVYVTTGLENDEWMEILSDNIKEGDVIVTSGHFTLAHDTAVNVMESGAPTGGR